MERSEEYVEVCVFPSHLYHRAGNLAELLEMGEMDPRMGRLEDGSSYVSVPQSQQGQAREIVQRFETDYEASMDVLVARKPPTLGDRIGAYVFLLVFPAIVFVGSIVMLIRDDARVEDRIGSVFALSVLGAVAIAVVVHRRKTSRPSRR